VGSNLAVPVPVGFQEPKQELILEPSSIQTKEKYQFVFFKERSPSSSPSKYGCSCDKTICDCSEFGKD